MFYNNLVSIANKRYKTKKTTAKETWHQMMISVYLSRIRIWFPQSSTFAYSVGTQGKLAVWQGQPRRVPLFFLLLQADFKWLFMSFPHCAIGTHVTFVGLELLHPHGPLANDE